MRTNRFVTTLLAAAAIAGCQKAETPEQAATRMTAEADAARPMIEAVLASYGRNYSASHTDSIVAIHAADAYVMPSNGTALHGTEAIRQMFTTQFQAGAGTLALHSEHLSVNGPMAIDRGRYDFTPPAGTPIPADSGKYLTHFELTDGRWLIAEVIWNSDLPLPSIPAPPARRR